MGKKISPNDSSLTLYFKIYTLLIMLSEVLVNFLRIFCRWFWINSSIKKEKWWYLPAILLSLMFRLLMYTFCLNEMTNDNNESVNSPLSWVFYLWYVKSAYRSRNFQKPYFYHFESSDTCPCIFTKSGCNKPQRADFCLISCSFSQIENDGKICCIKYPFMSLKVFFLYCRIMSSEWW